MNQLEEIGCKITYDWTTDEAFELDVSLNALMGVNGVLAADLVVLLFEDSNYAYRGTFTELGVAIGSGKKIYAICSDPKAKCRENVFFHHKNINHANDFELFLQELEKRMKSGALTERL